MLSQLTKISLYRTSQGVNRTLYTTALTRIPDYVVQVSERLANRSGPQWGLCFSTGILDLSESKLGFGSFAIEYLAEDAKSKLHYKMTY